MSKQAIFERLDADFISLCKTLLDKSVGAKTKPIKMLDRFANVYLHDSSCIQLPASLHSYYKGNSSRTGDHSVVKVQAIYNLFKNSFEQLTLSPYVRNDQSAAPDILPYLKKNDLVVRDLGYFTINSLREIINQNAHFISCLRSDVRLFCLNDKPINLKDLIKGRSFVKKKVLLGTSQKLPVTLIAIKANRSTAYYRRKNALKDRDRRKKITAEKLFLLGWEVFICSCHDIEIELIKKVYGLRWQIEIIFKSWKSHINLQKSIPAMLKRPFIPEAIIYLSLLLTTIFIMPIYHRVLKIEPQVSLLKLTRFIASTMPGCQWKTTINWLKQNLTLILYECRNRQSLQLKLRILT